MDHSATYLDSNDDEGSIWPWVVGLLALLGMLFAAAETVNAIPKSLATNVQRTLSAQNVSGVTVAVDGRDIRRLNKEAHPSPRPAALCSINWLSCYSPTRNNAYVCPDTPITQVDLPLTYASVVSERKPWPVIWFLAVQPPRKWSHVALVPLAPSPTIHPKPVVQEIGVSKLLTSNSVDVIGGVTWSTC